MSKVSDGFLEIIISRRWSLFATFTPRFSRKTEAFKDDYRFFMEYLNKRDRSFYRGCVDTMNFYERDDSRNGVHLHSLINGIGREAAGDLEKAGNYYFGNTCVLPYERRHAEYLVKKYASRGLDYWEITRTNSRLRTTGFSGGEKPERRSEEGICSLDRKRFLWADLNYFPSGLTFN